MKKDLQYFRDKLTALRHATDDLLREMEEKNPSPRKRQKETQSKFLQYDMMYNKKKRKTGCDPAAD